MFIKMAEIKQIEAKAGNVASMDLILEKRGCSMSRGKETINNAFAGAGRPLNS